MYDCGNICRYPETRSVPGSALTAEGSDRGVDGLHEGAFAVQLRENTKLAVESRHPRSG